MTAQPIRRLRLRPAPCARRRRPRGAGRRCAGWSASGAGDRAGLDEPLLAAAPPAEAADPAIRGGRVARGRVIDPDGELADIRADIDFWAARLAAGPGDIVAAVRLAEMRIAEARMTGDVTAYVARRGGRRRRPRRPAPVRAGAGRQGRRSSSRSTGSARHATLALAVLERTPDDPGALGVLGDASLELGDLATARVRLRRPRGRRGRLRGAPPGRAPGVRDRRPGRPPSPRPARRSPRPPTRASRATRWRSPT